MIVFVGICLHFMFYYRTQINKIRHQEYKSGYSVQKRTNKNPHLMQFMLVPCLHIVLQHIFLLYVTEHLSEILPAGCYKTALKEDHGTLYQFCNLIIDQSLGMLTVPTVMVHWMCTYLQHLASYDIGDAPCSCSPQYSLCMPYPGNTVCTMSFLQCSTQSGITIIPGHIIIALHIIIIILLVCYALFKLYCSSDTQISIFIQLFCACIACAHTAPQHGFLLTTSMLYNNVQPCHYALLSVYFSSDL